MNPRRKRRKERRWRNRTRRGWVQRTYEPSQVTITIDGKEIHSLGSVVLSYKPMMHLVKPI